MITTVLLPRNAEPGAAPLQVILVDDADSTRRFLRAVLNRVAALEVVGEAASGRDAVEEVQRLQPDIVLLDLSLPDIDGATLLPQLFLAAPAARIVVLSNNSRLAGPAMVAAGATGFIEKGLAPSALVAELSRVLGTRLLTEFPLPEA